MPSATAGLVRRATYRVTADELKGRVVGGEKKEAEVDGGYVKPANLKEHRKDRRFASNQNGKRKVVVIVRERQLGPGRVQQRKPSCLIYPLPHSEGNHGSYR
ncbi:hypothetical protein NLM33_19040 [Bradyrhizobium sp. CCGUVB1N3]|uniref:hypothetical protein n=1 Tax=Bradyrhizobium sp. CCGUVB1N3 TaxID=2949629 RepID=UPI0020B34250|nr:hypothetical protein [Bradyrhizobium sp. CCGUVB1N3]MCP3472411.1 hypothetical protein [Bradyrhizobium sp. CCGUVB1N3]